MKLAVSNYYQNISLDFDSEGILYSAYLGHDPDEKGSEALCVNTI